MTTAELEAPRAKPQSAPKVVAVMNAEVMRAIQQGGFKTWTELAQLAGRSDGSNVQTTVQGLERAGLANAAFPPALTEAGLAMLERLDAFEGKVPGDDAPGFVWLRRDQIRDDGPNARQWSGLLGDDIDELADSIAQRGFIQPPAVRPAGEDGLYPRAYGSRRLRAWARLIERGEWPADHTERLPLKTGSDEEIALDALVENCQRSDLDSLEFGEECLRMEKEFHRTAAQIAAAIGKGNDKALRTVQVALKTAREATPANKAAYKAGKITWTELRDSVGERTPKPALALPPREQVALVELAFVATFPSRACEVRGEPRFVKLADPPTGGPLSELHRKNLIALRPHEGAVYARVQIASRAGEWLKEIGFETDAAHAVREIRAKALGELEAQAYTAEGRFVTKELNLPPPREEAPPPDPSPLEGEGGAREASAEREGEGSKEPARAPVLEALPPKDWLTILEIAHAIQDHGMAMPGRPDRQAEVYDFHANPDAGRLAIDRLVGFGPMGAGKWGVYLTPTSWFRLKEAGLATAAGDLMISEDALAAAYVDADMAWSLAGYFTSWLNPPPPKAAETEPEDPAAAEAAAEATPASTPPTDLSAEASAKADTRDPFMRGILQVTGEIRALRSAVHALEAAQEALGKARTKKLEAAEVDQLEALINRAIELAKPHLDDEASPS